MSSISEPALTLDVIVAMLAPAIGAEKSREIVATVARTLGSFDAGAVLAALEEHAGAVGLAARRARAGMRMPAGTSTPNGVVASGPTLGPNSTPPQPSGELAPRRTIHFRAVSELLASSLGEEASAELVRAALRRLGIVGDQLDMRKATRLLEALAAVPGLVGITARFAKARVILLFSAPRGAL
jgi:hypothetical protein